MFLRWPDSSTWTAKPFGAIYATWFNAGKLKRTSAQELTTRRRSNRKLQAPTSKHQRSSKPSNRLGWYLDFGASLVLGAWNLEIPQVGFSRPPMLFFRPLLHLRTSVINETGHRYDN